MNVFTFLTLYAIGALVMVALDFVWLGIIAKDFYGSELGHLFGQMNWIPVALFYIIFLFGLTFFAIAPAVNTDKITWALLLGALFGFVTYTTYDLTNYATLRDWPLLVTVVDIAWGTFIGATVTTVTFFFYTTFVS